MISLDNLETFVMLLRQRGIDASPESRHDAIKGVQVGLTLDGRFYSLAELNRREMESTIGCTS
jgi:hypothetical protein